MKIKIKEIYSDDNFDAARDRLFDILEGYLEFDDDGNAINVRSLLQKIHDDFDFDISAWDREDYEELEDKLSLGFYFEKYFDPDCNGEFTEERDLNMITKRGDLDKYNDPLSTILEFIHEVDFMSRYDVKELDYKRMLGDINGLVDNDFCASMDAKTYSCENEFTREDSVEMARILARVYSISHCIHCKACAEKYLLDKK